MTHGICEQFPAVQYVVVDGSAVGRCSGGSGRNRSLQSRLLCGHLIEKYAVPIYLLASRYEALDLLCGRLTFLCWSQYCLPVVCGSPLYRRKISMPPASYFGMKSWLAASLRTSFRPLIRLLVRLRVLFKSKRKKRPVAAGWLAVL